MTGTKGALLALGLGALALSGCGMDSYNSERHAYDPWDRYPLAEQACERSMPDMRLNTRNLPTSGFGCAHQANIALMVADKNDLVRPRALSPADADRRLVVLEKYRAGDDTGADTDTKGSEALVTGQ